MDCPKCGYERQPEDTHCQLCGVDFGLIERQAAEKKALKQKEKAGDEMPELIMEEKDSEPEVVNKPIEEQAYCPKCGMERNAQDKECFNCGLIYSKHEEMVARKEAEKEAKKKEEEKRFMEEKERVQRELEKRIAKTRTKREEEARLADEERKRKSQEKDENVVLEVKRKLNEKVQLVKRNPKKVLLIMIAVFALVFAGWGGTYLIKSWQQSAKEKKIQAEKEEAKKRLAEKHQKIAAEFRADKAQIKKHLKSLIVKRKFDFYKKAMEKYDVPMLQNDLSEIKKYFKEIEFFDQAKWISGKEYEKNYEAYSDLAKMNPGSQLYAKKVKYYRKKLADEKYLTALNYFKKKHPYRSELKAAMADAEKAIQLEGAEAKYKKLKYRLENAGLLFFEGNSSVKMALRNDGLTKGVSGGHRKLYIWIKNTGSTPFYINVEYFTLIGRNNKKYKYHNFSRELITNVQPGETAQGYLYFYTSVTPKKLIFSPISAGTISRVFP